MTSEFDPVVLLLVGLAGITLLGAGLWSISTRGDQDDIVVPLTYGLASWFRRRRSVKHEDVDETHRPDSSD